MANFTFLHNIPTELSNEHKFQNLYFHGKQGNFTGFTEFHSFVLKFGELFVLGNFQAKRSIIC